MVLIKIDGLVFYVSAKVSVLEACKYVGITLPRFCYHESLSVAGNCRMCLVEIENSPKPVVSCAFPVVNNMRIYTDTPLVKKARENVLEAILLNHPLDCPICDQGGECDLQDQTKAFGGISSRTFLHKRVVEDKNFSPLIKTIMTRCIHCTRCVRFDTEINGVEVLGTLNRGGSTEIGNYSTQFTFSEMSGNVLELCPVGALTSKPYAFKARPWELRSVENIDLTDGLGSSVYIHTKDSEILRITPKINNDINGNFISDKARFFYDSLQYQRLSKVYCKAFGLFELTGWNQLLQTINLRLLEKKSITFIVDDELAFLELLYLKAFQNKFKFISVCKLKDFKPILNYNITRSFSVINQLKENSKFCFIFSSNVRVENAVLNSKLRLKYNSSDIKFFGSNCYYNSNFSISFINLNLLTFVQILESKHISVSKILNAYVNSIVIFGDQLSTRGVCVSSLNLYLKKRIPTILTFFLRLSANQAAFDFSPVKSITNSVLMQTDCLFLVNLDDKLILNKLLQNFKKETFWFNTHNSALAKKCAFLIPIFDIFEEKKIVLNLEERPQESQKVLSNSGDARSFAGLLQIYVKSYVVNNSFKFFFEVLKTSNKFLKIFNLFSNRVSFSDNVLKFSIVSVPTIVKNFFQTNKSSKNSVILLKAFQKQKKYLSNFNF